MCSEASQWPPVVSEESAAVARCTCCGLEQAADQTPRCCAARCTWRRLVVTVVGVACLPLTALCVTADVLVEVVVVSAVVVVGGVVDR